MKAIWKQCWGEFTSWFGDQWKYAWDFLKVSILGLIQSVFEWLKVIVGGLFVGLWKLVIKPFGKYLYETIVAWVKKI